MSESNGVKTEEVFNASDDMTKQLITRLLMANALASRSQFTKSLLDPRRKLDNECGYPEQIEDEDYQQMYDREAIARRVVDFWPDQCWKVLPLVKENEDQEDTVFETALKELDDKHSLWNHLHRIDKLSGVGHFGLLIFGLNDGKKLDQQFGNVDAKGIISSSKKDTEILYMLTVPSTLIQIAKQENDEKSPRFGLPTEYLITLQKPSSIDTGEARKLQSFTQEQKRIHWTRCVHIADQIEYNRVLATPRMQVVFNRLMDLRKVYGSSAEMFWLGAFAGFALETINKEGSFPADFDDIKEEMQKYFNGLQRWMAAENAHVNSLSPTVADPAAHIAVYIEAICIALDVPKRIFMGSERGELASSQDTGEINDSIRGRQFRYCLPSLVKPVIERLIAYGVLPEPTEDLIYDWEDLEAPSPLDKANLGKVLIEVIVAYVNSGANTLVPEFEFLTIVLGMDDETAEAILEAAEEKMAEMEAELAEMEAQAEEQQLQQQPGEPQLPNPEGE